MRYLRFCFGALFVCFLASLLFVEVMAFSCHFPKKLNSFTFQSLCPAVAAGSATAQGWKDSKDSDGMIGGMSALAEAAAGEGSVLVYGLISGGAELYSDSLLSRAITTLPATYFVVILEENALFLRVSYADLTGYMQPSSVEKVDYEPVTKYAFPAFSVLNDGYPATLRSSPDHLGDNKIYELPAGGEGKYYGSCLGSSMIAEVGNLWYYVRYESGGKSYSGYVYKSQIVVEAIAPNVIEKVERQKEPSAPNSPFEIESIESILIIIALTLPAAFITLVIFKKPTTPNPPPRFTR